MKITDITVRKVDHNDPRYPDQAPDRPPFVDVYLCSITVEGGEPFEAPYFVQEYERAMTPDAASIMLKLFASGIADMDKKQEAA